MSGGCNFQRCPLGWHLLSVSQRCKVNYQKQSCIWLLDSMIWEILGKHNPQNFGDYAFNLQVPAGTWVQPKLIPYLPSRKFGSSMQQLSLQPVGFLSAQRMLLLQVELSWLRGRKKDRFADFILASIIKNNVSAQHMYLSPNIPEIVDKQRERDFQCLLDLKSGL